MLTGALEPTNQWYAIAKIAGIKLCESLRKQHGFDALSLMPTNLYGPGDNYQYDNSHVLPALIRRFYEAKLKNEDTVLCWGTGKPLREFLHVDDLGDACVFCLEIWSPKENDMPLVNVGTGKDISIKKLTELISAETLFSGSIHWDTNKPDGTPKKQLDVSRLVALGWKASIPLELGVKNTISHFKHEYQNKLIRI